MIGFRFVDEHKADHAVVDLCRATKVSRTAYYAWRNRPPSKRAVVDAELTVEIREIHQRSRGTYGAPRIAGQLRRSGHHASRHRVARLMRAEGLVGAHGRRKWRRGRHPAMAPAPDLLERDFTAERSDQRWVADISEFGCCDGKLYLAGIRDLHDHTLVGWSMGERQTTDLVVAALVMALGRRNPSGELLHHADHGCQGEINRSSQHLPMMEVSNGATAADGGQGTSSGDAVARAADPGASCGARVLAVDRRGQAHRGSGGWCRGVGPRRVSLVSSRWRDDAFASRRAVGPVLVVRGA